MKYFNNLFTIEQFVNCFKDFFEIYNGQQVNEMIRNNINNFTASSEQLAELGMDVQDVCSIEYVTIKCFNCYNIVGIYDTINKKYIIFNAI